MRILGSVFVDASEVVIESMLSTICLVFFPKHAIIHSHLDLPKLEIFYIPGVFSLRGGVSDNTNNDSLYSMFTNLRERSLIMRSMWLEKR